MGSIGNLIPNMILNSSLKLEPKLETCPFDCETGVSESEQEQPRNGMFRIGNGETTFEMVKNKLVSSLGFCGFSALVESIHGIDFAGNAMNRAKLESFCRNSRAVEIKCGGDANGKYAWFGASKNEINGIISHGFRFPTHGQGVYLSPANYPFQSMQLATPDKDGLKHMLLCRVILGKSEALSTFSEHYKPNSEEFDSGVDEFESPQKYIVWTSRMNSHILPEFVVSFRAASYCRESQRTTQYPRPPKSDWMSFPILITWLHKLLPSDAVELIKKHHSDFKKRKITRYEMIKRVRQIAGDKLLKIVISMHRRKMKAQSMGG